ncbi:50S ribosomal protein L9 [Nitrospirota bacterium]
MKVILKDEVQHLGKIGDVVTVARGYARNFLLPQGFAVIADTKNVKALEHEQRIMAERARKYYEASQVLAEKIGAIELSFTAKVGEEEKLFGSVTSMDIAAALKDKGIEVDKRKISIAEPIKSLGEHEVEVKVAHEVSATVKITVEAE